MAKLEQSYIEEITDFNHVFSFQCSDCELEFNIGIAGRTDDYHLTTIGCPVCGQDTIADEASILCLDNRYPEVLREIHLGNKITAIKTLRMLTGKGLKEAKHAVEQIMREDFQLE